MEELNETLEIGLSNINQTLDSIYNLQQNNNGGVSSFLLIILIIVLAGINGNLRDLTKAVKANKK